jgi:hypothetical protein
LQETEKEMITLRRFVKEAEKDLPTGASSS